MEYLQRYRAISKTARLELSELSKSRYALLGATVTGLVFEWSPANEAMLGAVGVNAHEKFGTSGTIGDSIINRIVTGAITGGASFTEQAIVGSLTALSLSKFPRTFKEWQERRSSDARQTVSSSGSALTALALGSSVAVVENKLVNKNASTQDNLKLALKTSAIVGIFNFMLAGGVSTGLDALDRNGQQELSGDIADLVKNPLLYLGIFGLAKAIELIKNKNQQNSQKIV